MSKRVGLCVGFVLAILSVAATPSCSAPAAPNGAGGSSGSSASSGSSGTSGSSGSSGTTPVQDIAESEPNNGPDMAGMQNVGVIDGSKTLRIKGRLDSGGMNATAYTGDFDGFAFEIKSAGGSLSTTVDWTGSADVDAILYDSNLNALAGDNTAAKPISQSAPIPAGKYALVLFSKDQPADWTLTFAYGTTPPGSSGSSGTSGASGTSGTSGGTGCIDATVLTGGYWQKNNSFEEIHFKDGGSLDDGYYLPPSGTVWSTGTWTLSCPTITATIANKPYAFTISGTTLTDSGGRTWARCAPLSNGECF